MIGIAVLGLTTLVGRLLGIVCLLRTAAGDLAATCAGTLLWTAAQQGGSAQIYEAHSCGSGSLLQQSGQRLPPMG